MSLRQFISSEPIFNGGGEDVKPTAILVWGPPGAGKSTLLDQYPPETLFKNVDDIVQFHCQPNNSSEYWVCRESPITRGTDKYLNHLATSQHKNLAIETTGNWYEPSWASDLLKQGFGRVEVMCVFVNSVDELWKRIQNRQQLSVNYQQLLSTYVKSYYTNMEALIKDDQISELRIFDNSKTETNNSSRKTDLIYSKNMNVSFPNDTLPEMSQAYINWIRSISRD